MRAYISVSFKMRNDFNNEIESIKSALIENNFKPFVFVDNYKFSIKEEKIMMQTAMNDIDISEILIAETSDKGIGIGIEAGYAKAKNKIVIYLRNTKNEHSTTLSGLSDYHVIYETPIDLKNKLLYILKKLQITSVLRNGGLGEI